MDKFAFILHPLIKDNIARKYPVLRRLPERVVGNIIKHIKPQPLSQILGITSEVDGDVDAEKLIRTEGWFIGLPLLPYQFSALPIEFVYGRIVECCEIAEDLGANIVGLGAFTSVVGDAGETVERILRERGRKIAVTTGNSYTVAMAIEGALEAARLMEISIENANVVVVGATGSIGYACSILLNQEDMKSLTVVGRNINSLQLLVRDLENGRKDPPVFCSTDIKESLREADIIITVTSAIDAIIEPDYLKPGCVVCDVARPRDVSKAVAEQRNDVLVIDGGIVEVPGNVDFGFDFGFPPRTSYACMAETMILALEERRENYSLGRELDTNKVLEIRDLGRKHGFRLAGLRSFEEEVLRGRIEQIKEHAFIARRGRR